MTAPRPGGVQRVALITGCGKADGIGAAIALALSRSGMSVVATDVASGGVQDDQGPQPKESGLESLVARITAEGGSARAALGDVSSEADAAALVDTTIGHFSRIDILVNNAAAPQRRDRNDIIDIPTDAWDLVMAVNVRGAFLMARAAIPFMRDQKWGRIVNISSAVGVYAARNLSAYSTSKAAVLGFTRAVAMDVAPWGITVNALCPGAVSTGRALASISRTGWASAEEGLAARARGVPLGRNGTVEDMAAMVRFLVSEDASYMTGQTLVVDGGKGGQWAITNA